MAQRVNGIAGMIERILKNFSKLHVDDTGELAKVFARLERVAEELGYAEHPATAFALLLVAAIEQVIDGHVTAQNDPLGILKEGLLALQAIYKDPEEGGLDSEAHQVLVDQIRGLAQQDLSENGAEMIEAVVEVEEVGEAEAVVEVEEADEVEVAEAVVEVEEADEVEVVEAVVEVEEADEVEERDVVIEAEVEDTLGALDDINWKAVPTIDLDALESQVQAEQQKPQEVPTDSALEAPEVSDVVADETVSEEADLEKEAVVIREQLTTSGYVLFDGPATGVASDVIDDSPEMTEQEEDLFDDDDDDDNSVFNAVTAFLSEPSVEDAKPDTDMIEEELVGTEMNANDAGDEDAVDTFWTDANPDEKSDVEVVQSKKSPLPSQEEEEQGVLAQLAIDVMTVGIDDMSGLGRVHTALETMAGDFGKDRSFSLQLVRGLAVVVEKIILFECDDIDDPLSLVRDGVLLLQRMDYDVVSGKAEKVTDDVLFEKIKVLGEIDESEFEVEETSDMEVDSTADHKPNLDTAVDVAQDIFFDFASEAEEHLTNAESHLLTLEANPEDKEIINAVFRAFHTIKGAAGFLNLKDVTSVAHRIEDILDSARKGSLVLTPSFLDVALESLDLLRQLIMGVKEKLEQGQPVFTKDVSAFLERVENVVSGKAVPAKKATPVESEASDHPVSTNNKPEEGASKESPAAKREHNYVRVGTDRLDMLVNLVGELVIAQTQVSQNPDIISSENQKLTKDIAQLMKISSDIQEISMSMRMVPIRSTFERMARIVRDLSRKCDKQVQFEMSGEDTELDKNVVEELVDPLTHMVRNSVDHGIEPEEDREMAGKPKAGIVKLHAYHKGGNIVIELRDDGKGLNRDKILQKGIERGLVSADAQLSDEEIFKLIFLPGFSTADKISDISGRGVGMDVVRRNIEGLRGQVEVTSKPGQGSIFTIRLPLTLAIIDGMVIGVGNERYILPLTAILSSLRPQKEDVFHVMGKGEMIRVQEELLPVVRLYERFGTKPLGENIWESLVVIVEAEGKRCGVMVDELLGMQQVVIKGLHDGLRKESCLSGCAILGDGRVGLILDANGLVRSGTAAHPERNGKAYRSAS